MNFRRRVALKNEVSFLVPVLASWCRAALSKMSVAAAVGNLEVPAKLRNIDVKPCALGSVLTDRNAAPPASNDPDGNVGLDVKWGVRQTLVADFTVNTDFAQVEDDEQQLNLTRFSLQFPENVTSSWKGRTPSTLAGVRGNRGHPAGAAASRAAGRTPARCRCSFTAGGSG
jgi:hypothetical protein